MVKVYYRIRDTEVELVIGIMEGETRKNYVYRAIYGFLYEKYGGKE